MLRVAASELLSGGAVLAEAHWTDSGQPAVNAILLGLFYPLVAQML